MKREDIKAVLPDIADAALDRIMQLHNADIDQQKNTVATLTTEKNLLSEQLTAANGKLEGYDPDWKTKAENAKTAAEQQIEALKRSYAGERAVSGLKFSSESAKRAFLSDLSAKNLPLREDGTLLGFDQYRADYAKADPGAFLPEGGVPHVTAGTPGIPAELTGKDAANAAFRSIFGKE